MILGPDRNAQKVLDPGFLEMSYQNAALAKLCREKCTAAVAMAREYEVRHGWKNLEVQLQEGVDER